MKLSLKMLLPGLAAALALVSAAQASTDEKPFLSPIFTSNMVLQRGVADPVWGWTDPGARITVAVNGRSTEALSDASGRWQAKVGPLPVGGPYTMTISGPRQV